MIEEILKNADERIEGKYFKILRTVVLYCVLLGSMKIIVPIMELLISDKITINGFKFLFSLVSSIFYFFIPIGLCRYLLNLIRNNEMTSDLFSGVAEGKKIWTNFCIGLFICIDIIIAFIVFSILVFIIVTPFEETVGLGITPLVFVKLFIWVAVTFTIGFILFRYMFAVMYLEDSYNKTASECVKYSKQLVKGHFFQILWAAIRLYYGTIIVSIAAYLITYALTYYLGSNGVDSVSKIYDLIINLVFICETPRALCAYIELYFKLAGKDRNVNIEDNDDSSDPFEKYCVKPKEDSQTNSEISDQTMNEINKQIEEQMNSIDISSIDMNAQLSEDSNINKEHNDEIKIDNENNATNLN